MMNFAELKQQLQILDPKDVGNFSVTPAGLLAYRHQAVTEGSLAWIGRAFLAP